MNTELDKKIEEIIEQYTSKDDGLLLIGKYDFNLLKSALYQVAEYLQKDLTKLE